MIDLHIHTTCSDGKLSPVEVIDEAYKNGVFTISIADHDTIDAYTEEVMLYARNKGIDLIPAVEVSSKYKGIGVHILGYNFDIGNLEIREFLRKLRNSRRDYLCDVSSKLDELGYVVDVFSLEKVESVTKAHIANDVISSKGNEDILLKEFGKIPTMDEFIENIMNEGCSGYVPKKVFSPLECAKIIRNAGGKVVLAHPVCYKWEDNMSDEDIYSLVEKIAADGVEADYIYINRNGEKINECNKWREFALENNLFVTVGSDFHEFDNVHPVIGLVNEDIYLDDKDINNILLSIKE